MRRLFSVVWLALPAVALACFALTPRASAEAPASSPSSPSHEVWHRGGAEDFVPSLGATRGGLLLLGGGGDVDAAWRWFVACAGGGDIVVLRASGGDGYQDYVYERVGGVASVTTIKFLDAAAAHDPAVLARITAAEGVFLAGGDQSRYVRLWKNTPVAAALDAHVAAGKPFGGTSAGLAVLGEHVFAATHGGVTSGQALEDPFHERVTLEQGFLRVPALAGVITDSHFSERDRLGRLAVFLARLQAERPDAPRLAGLGLDEATALCVEPDGMARVHALRGGSVWLARLVAPATLRPLDARLETVRFGAGAVLDLGALTVGGPSVRAFHRVEPGRIAAEPSGAPRADTT